MLIENDALGPEKREDLPVADVSAPVDEDKTSETGVDDAPPSPTVTPETEPMLVTSGAPETESEPASDEPADSTIEASKEGEPEPSDKRLERKKRKERRKKERKPRPAPAVTQVVSWFAACGRCSFFLAGYKTAGGEGALETAVAKRKKQWLPLIWNHAMVNLVHKSYGSRVDIHCYHYEGRCQECRRRFVYHAADKDKEPTFRIELKT